MSVFLFYTVLFLPFGGLVLRDREFPRRPRWKRHFVDATCWKYSRPFQGYISTYSLDLYLNWCITTLHIYHLQIPHQIYFPCIYFSRYLWQHEPHHCIQRSSSNKLLRASQNTILATYLSTWYRYTNYYCTLKIESNQIKHVFWNPFISRRGC